MAALSQPPKPAALAISLLSILCSAFSDVFHASQQRMCSISSLRAENNGGNNDQTHLVPPTRSEGIPTECTEHTDPSTFPPRSSCAAWRNARNGYGRAYLRASEDRARCARRRSVKCEGPDIVVGGQPGIQRGVLRLSCLPRRVGQNNKLEIGGGRHLWSPRTRSKNEANGQPAGICSVPPELVHNRACATSCSRESFSTRYHVSTCRL